MARSNARFLYSRYPETGIKDVGDEIDHLERHLRDGPRPKEAVSSYEREKQEILPY